MENKKAGNHMNLLLISYSDSMANFHIAQTLRDEWKQLGCSTKLYDTVSAENCAESLWFVAQTNKSVLPGTILKKLSVAVRHPVHAWRTYVTDSRSGFQRRAVHEICALVQKENVDYVVVFSLPFEIAYALSKVLPAGKLILYQLDPYYLELFIGEKEKKRRLRMEEKTFSRLAHCFTTPLLLQQYQTSPLAAVCKKMTAVEFPCVVPPVVTNDTAIFDAKYYNCVYAGKLASSIRDGKTVCKIFAEVFQKEPLVRLTIYGQCLDDAFVQLEKEYPQNVSFMGRVSQQEIQNVMQQADVLINIGNNLFNQLPSKTLNYISVGKPILNFYELQNCPTLPYVDRYPLGKSVFIHSETAVDDIVHFVHTARGKQCPYSDVETLFFDCTPHAVAAQCLDAISK